MGVSIDRRAVGLVAMTLAIPFPRRPRTPAPTLQPEQAEQEDRRPAGRADDRGGIGIGPEVARRDQVLDLRRARQGVHREREGPERDRARDQPLGDVGLAEHHRRERIHRERHHEQRDPSVGQDRAGEHDRQDRPPGAERPDDLRRDRTGRAARLHQLAEDRPQQEHGEERLHVIGRAPHERLGVARQQGTPRQAGRQQREDRREDDDGQAPIGERHQQDQREHDREHLQAHRLVPPGPVPCVSIVGGRIVLAPGSRHNRGTSVQGARPSGAGISPGVSLDGHRFFSDDRPGRFPEPPDDRGSRQIAVSSESLIARGFPWTVARSPPGF